MGSKTTKPSSVAEEIGKLESTVTELMALCNQLQSENKSLKIRQEALVAERAGLIQKHDLARTRVESMITRLKAMETAA